jgi:dephospho-CoA kinase
MRVIGLTGGIASGKSTVSEMLRELGAPIVDADLLARQVVEPGAPALAEIVERFGAGVLDEDGRLDRKKLGAIVFDDAAARRDLNRITHPRIAAAGQEAIAAHGAAGAAVVIYDAALIVENNLHRALAGLIVVSLPRDVQRQRLMERDDIDAEAAEARIAAQLPLEEKVAVADYVVDNSGTLEQTRSQVEAIWTEINSAGENEREGD